MKTDNEDTLRVTLTFRRESSPEWYALLLKTTSGRARAEHVRQHLTLPRFAISAETIPPLPAQSVKASIENTVISAPAQGNNSSPSVSTPIEGVNSSAVFVDKSVTYDKKKFTENATVNGEKVEESDTINSNPQVQPTVLRTRGGMAKMVNTVNNSGQLIN
jgi:hypothetical protein